jgi:8-oxo-dGTP diphosphatase
MLEPAVGVAAVVVVDRRLLLGLRIATHGDGCWQLPGGKPHPEDTGPESTALRELREETGMSGIRAIELARQVDDFPAVGKRYTTLFMGIQGPAGTPVNREPEKNAGWSWFELDALPQPLFAIDPPTLEAIRRFALR